MIVNHVVKTHWKKILSAAIAESRQKKYTVNKRVKASG
jgi:hypothetical protein